MAGRINPKKVVLVSGDLSGISEGTLRLIFKNEPNNGGGPIDELALFHDKQAATVVYRDEKGKVLPPYIFWPIYTQK